MPSKENPSVRKAVELTTRREVLRRGTAIAAVSAITPFWTRLARAQTATTAFDYFISPTGLDSNPGTLASPWSLNALNSKSSVYAGKRVGIIGDQGTYNCLSIYIAGNGGSTLAPPRGSPGYGPPAFNIAAGTSGSPTYIGSCNSSGVYVPRLAVLDGGSTSLSQSSTVNPGANAILGAISPSTGYITLDGLVFQNNQYNYVSFGSDTTVNPSSRSPGIVVQNCHFGGSGTLYNSVVQENPTFLTLYPCVGALIQNNLFDGATNDSTNRFEGFEQWATSGTIFQYNTVVVQQNGCAFSFVKNINNSNVTFRYNYFFSASAAGGEGWDLSGTSSSTSYFYNNVVVAGDYAWNTPGEAMTDADSAEIKHVYNNTFVAQGGSWANEGIFQRSGAGTMTVYNNIVNRTGSHAWGGDYSFSANALALSDYNLFPSTPSLGLMAAGSDSATPTLYSSISTWAAALSSGCIGKDAHSVLGTPTFVGGSPTFPAEAYKLAAGSLGIGAGSSNGEPSGSPVDMGAWGGTDVNTGQPIAQIGCNFVAGSTSGSLTAPPSAPVLSVS
jgi:hypothetical protein